MSHYIRQGNTYKVTNTNTLDIQVTLPVGNYIIQEDIYGNLFLEMVESFEINFKLYGDTTRNTTRIIDTFLDRSQSTGVMLSGEKGSGKSLLAKNLSIKAASLGIPTIIINVPWCGERFNSFIQSIDQPCVILFDEFEKVYDSEKQEGILTLLDGVFPTKKLFVLTCNNQWKVDEHMRNRPGRIYYMIDFNGVDKEFVEEYCDDNLNDKQYTQTIQSMIGIFDTFNFDMLKALVEEMNRYNETPQQAMNMLNINPMLCDKDMFDVISVVDNQVIVDPNTLDSKRLRINPLQGSFSIEYYNRADDDKYCCVYFNDTNLKNYDTHSGVFTFINDTGSEVKLLRSHSRYTNYTKLLV